MSAEIAENKNDINVFYEQFGDGCGNLQVDMAGVTFQQKNILSVLGTNLVRKCFEMFPETAGRRKYCENCYETFTEGYERLQLGISRETLQQNKILRVIEKDLVRKCFEMFPETAGRKTTARNSMSNWPTAPAACRWESRAGRSSRKMS